MQLFLDFSQYFPREYPWRNLFQEESRIQSKRPKQSAKCTDCIGVEIKINRL